MIVLPEYIVFPGETPWQDIDDPIERNKACSRQQQRVWRKLHPGSTAEKLRKYRGEHPGYDAKYRERCPERFAKATKKFLERHPGYFAEATRRFLEQHSGYITDYNKTPKGRANLARHTAKRREYTTNPEAYAARVELLHITQEPCANCHTPYKITYQIDHILALCLGGTDN